MPSGVAAPPVQIVDDASRPDTQSLLSVLRRLQTANLTASLYRRAMEGNIPALIFWLSHYPESPFFRKSEAAKQDPLDAMTDEELEAYAHSMGVDLPTTIPFTPTPEPEFANQGAEPAGIPAPTKTGNDYPNDYPA